MPDFFSFNRKGTRCSLCTILYFKGILPKHPKRSRVRGRDPGNHSRSAPGGRDAMARLGRSYWGPSQHPHSQSKCLSWKMVNRWCWIVLIRNQHHTGQNTHSGCHPSWIHQLKNSVLALVTSPNQLIKNVFLAQREAVIDSDHGGGPQLLSSVVPLF